MNNLKDVEKCVDEISKRKEVNIEKYITDNRDVTYEIYLHKNSCNGEFDKIVVEIEKIFSDTMVGFTKNFYTDQVQWTVNCLNCLKK